MIIFKIVYKLLEINKKSIIADVARPVLPSTFFSPVFIFFGRKGGGGERDWVVAFALELLALRKHKQC